MGTVNLIDVSKSYSQGLVLDKINFEVGRGEFVAIVGPSGCGKSTLLRLVAGLEELSAGSILINNKLVNKIPPPKRDMAMVFQNYALYPHMTVYNNMAYGLKMRKMKAQEIQDKVHKVASLLQLTHFLDRKPNALSGGQRQRVAMGRAIVREPAVFLFDEPLSNLDAKLRAEMRYEIKKLYQQLKTTCLYVTHDQTEAMTMATKIVVLNKGNVEQIGPPQELYTKPNSVFVASFTGHYPMNFLPATAHVGLNFIEGPLGLRFPMPPLEHPISDNDDLLIGIRPEHLNLRSHNERTIPVKIDFIDDMGADKLIQLISKCGSYRFAVRKVGDDVLDEENLGLEVIENKANLFHLKSGFRLGGWHG